MKTLLLFIGLFLLNINAIATERSVDNTTCGIKQGKPLYSGKFGPFDYTDPRNQDKRPVVENAHFTSEVERLIRGIGSPTPGGDIQYTLRKFPNHHRALYAMLRYQTTPTKWNYGKGPNDIHILYTFDCFIKRAIYFKPDDPIVYMLAGIYFQRKNEPAKAEEHYLKAYELSPSNPEINYNLGLFYVKRNELDKAARHAKLAYETGYPLNGLRNKLKRANVSIK